MTKTKSAYFSEALTVNDVLLAPMAGVTDAAFRTVCRRMGAGMMFTEMISAKGLFYNNKNTADLLMLGPEETDTGVQIFGADEYYLSEAVKRFLNDSRFAFIDVNMGCPVRKITANGEGSALLSDTGKLYRVAKAVCEASEKPVSAKIRLGTDETHINCVENAAALEDAGIEMITVHGRTKEAMYTGKADKKAIAAVVKAVNIPVVANGDVFSAADYSETKRITGCRGVMVARGAMGNPFIFAEIAAAKAGRDPIPSTDADKLTEALAHFDLLVQLKGEKTACREFRKQICWYTKGMPGGAALRGRVAELETREAIVGALQTLTAELR